METMMEKVDEEIKTKREELDEKVEQIRNVCDIDEVKAKMNKKNCQKNREQLKDLLVRYCEKGPEGYRGLKIADFDENGENEIRFLCEVCQS